MTDATSSPQPSDSPTAAGATVLTGSESPAPMPADPQDRLLVSEAAEHRRPHPEGGEHGAHPTDTKYMIIAFGLACLTGIEIAISYIKGIGIAGNPILIALAALKFGIVVGYFMHLRFDNHIFRKFFFTGIILAICVYTAVLLMLGVFSYTHGAHR